MRNTTVAAADNGYLVTADLVAVSGHAPTWSDQLRDPRSAGQDFSVLRSDSAGADGETHCFDIQFAADGRMDYAEQGMLMLTLVEGAHEIFPDRDWAPLPARSLAKRAAVVGARFPGAQRWCGAWRSFTVGVAPQLLTEILPGNSQWNGDDGRWCYALPDNDRQFMHAMEAMRADLWSGCPTGSLFRDALTRGLLQYFFTRYANLPVAPTSPNRGLSASQLRLICDFIEANLSGKLSLSALASELGMSPWHFSKLFKRSKGMAPYQFVMKRRIEVARERLHGSRRVSIAALSCELGFADQSKFSAIFKRHTGLTPKQFAKCH